MWLQIYRFYNLFLVPFLMFLRLSKWVKKSGAPTSNLHESKFHHIFPKIGAVAHGFYRVDDL
jgi:hypothetical protein